VPFLSVNIGKIQAGTVSIIAFHEGNWIMRALTAAALLCVLSACSTAPSRPTVIESAPVQKPVDAMESARNENRHWLAPTLIDGFPASVDADYRAPARLAVLLPQTGSLAIAGNAIRDGLLSAYYAETRSKPGIRFYDSQGTAAGISAALQQAIKDGAQMVIGGIGKEEVTALAAAEAGIPVLALNRIEAPRNRMLLNFSLSPEREGELIAERLLARKLLSAGLFHQGSESDSRAIAAFEKRYVQGGGTLVWRALAPKSGTDENGEPVAPVLPATLGEAKAVVLWLSGDAAKPLRAAMTLAGAAAMPVFASADIAAVSEARTNADLNGIEFLQMPWLAAAPNAQGMQASQLLKLPSARGPGAALNAFGADAWLIATRLPVWLASPKTEIAGATGSLHLDPDGRIERRLVWRVYRAGVAQNAND
jgi:hypothetical protein